MTDKKSLMQRVFGDKRQWRAYVKRCQALPNDYRIVIVQIQKFMWTVAMDAQVVVVLYDILDLFEEGVADGRPVLDVTGDDVADFALSVLQAVQAETWTSKQARQLNNSVHEQLGVRQSK
ncbi:MAG: DUF1048 domain-containing protein [Propionibacteriaceae bacterium]|nr:DUF1048 domain-containing protein [Propionibacteriaceae bacterium]